MLNFKSGECAKLIKPIKIFEEDVQVWKNQDLSEYDWVIGDKIVFIIDKVVLKSKKVEIDGYKILYNGSVYYTADFFLEKLQE